MKRRLTLYKKELKNKKVKLIFEGELTIYTPQQFITSMLKFIKKYKLIQCSLSGVEKIDTAGFQALQFLRREADRKKKSIEINDVSDEVTRLYTLYGEQW